MLRIILAIGIRAGARRLRGRARLCPAGDARRPRPAPFVSTSPAVDAAATANDDWWRLYRDPVLDGLIADALAANTDIRVAVARLARARASLREVRSDRLPQATAGASATYGRASAIQARAGRRPRGLDGRCRARRRLRSRPVRPGQPRRRGGARRRRRGAGRCRCGARLGRRRNHARLCRRRFCRRTAGGGGTDRRAARPIAEGDPAPRRSRPDHRARHRADRRAAQSAPGRRARDRRRAPGRAVPPRDADRAHARRPAAGRRAAHRDAAPRPADPGRRRRGVAGAPPRRARGRAPAGGGDRADRRRDRRPVPADQPGRVGRLDRHGPRQSVRCRPAQLAARPADQLEPQHRPDPRADRRGGGGHARPRSRPSTAPC